MLKLLRRAAGVIGRFPRVLWARREMELARSYAAHPELPAVYFPYRIEHIHQVWRSTIANPPVNFAPYKSAQLSHFLNWGPLDKAEICFVPPHNGRLKKVRVPGCPKPFVIEAEHLLAIAGNIADWQWGLRHTDHINRIVEQDECRAVCVLSLGLLEHGKRYLRADLWPKLHQVNIAYPAQSSYVVPDRPFTILTVASRFYDKGIPEAIEAFRALRARHGKAVRMVLVCHVLPANYALPDGIEVHSVFPMNEEFRQTIYRGADVFVLPVYSDSCGCFVECMAFGVPIITTRITHGDEVVRDGFNGFLVETPLYSYSEEYGVKWKVWADFVADCERRSTSGELATVVSQIVERLEVLMKDRVTLENMRSAARTHHAQNFSTEVRNEKLRKIYRHAAMEKADCDG